MFQALRSLIDARTPVLAASRIGIVVSESATYHSCRTLGLRIRSTAFANSSPLECRPNVFKSERAELAVRSRPCEAQLDFTCCSRSGNQYKLMGRLSARCIDCAGVHE